MSEQDLRALQSELAAIRFRLRVLSPGYPVDTGRTLVWPIVGAVVLGALAGLSGLLGLIAALTGEAGLAAFFLVVACAAGVPAVLFTRRIFAALRPMEAEYEALRRREHELVSRLASIPIAVGPTGVPDDLPLPAGRQPTRYAELMWARFPFGPSPEDALRRLPPDAPPWLVGFHRNVGYGLLIALGLAGAIVTTYVVLLAVR